MASKSKKPPRILCIDFDGTCVEHCYPDVGGDVGAVPYLKALSDGGVLLILWTMRSGDKALPDIRIPGKLIPSPLMDAVAWFEKHQIKLWGINKNPDQHTWTESPKAYAERYVDDAAHGCPLTQRSFGPPSRPFVDWSIVGPELLFWAGIAEDDE